MIDDPVKVAKPLAEAVVTMGELEISVRAEDVVKAFTRIFAKSKSAKYARVSKKARKIATRFIYDLDRSF